MKTTPKPQPLGANPCERAEALTLGLLLGVMAMAAVAGAAAPAVTPLDPVEQEPVVLSPFVLAAERDTGWTATATLAGSRMRTDFADTAAKIEVLTKEFMEDLAAGNPSQAFGYTLNVESRVDYANVAGNEVDARMRGLAAATRSRNFFKQTLDLDNYNLERVTIASGPNAILFGIGSPAGIVDASYKTALMRNAYAVGVQADTNHGTRYEIDLNHVIVPKRLALRIAALTEDQRYATQPSWTYDDRRYGAVTFQPTPTTTLRLHGEFARQSDNRPPLSVPGDNFTPYFVATGGALVDNRVQAERTRAQSTGLVSGAVSGPIVILNSGAPIGVQAWTNSLQTVGPRNLPGLSPYDDYNWTITDLSLLPPALGSAPNLFGDNLDRGRKRARVLMAVLEQKLPGGVFLEVAYNRESGTGRNSRVMGNGAQILTFDPNQFIPNPTLANPAAAQLAAFSPNPFAGQLYVDGTNVGGLSRNLSDDFRLSLAREFDFRRAPRWGWLGRHRLAALFNRSFAQTKNQGGVQRMFIEPAGNVSFPGVTLTAIGANNWGRNSSRRPNFRYYVRDGASAPVPGDPLETWYFTDAAGRAVPAVLFDNPYGGNNPTVGAQSLLREYAFAWQGFLLRDRLVLTYGYRASDVRTAQIAAESLRQDLGAAGFTGTNSGLYLPMPRTSFAPYGYFEDGINRTAGAVAHLRPWLSVFANRSSTFDVSDSRVDAYDRIIPGQRGRGLDFGLRLNLREQRLQLEAGAYRNTLAHARSNRVNASRSTLESIEFAVREIDPSLPRIEPGFPSRGFNSYALESEFTAEGFEVQGDWRPRPGLMLRLTAAKQETFEHEIATTFQQWIAERLPVWQRLNVPDDPRTTGVVDPVTWQTAPVNAASPGVNPLAAYYRSQIDVQFLQLAQSAEGRSNDLVRKWRANFVGRYDFQHGWLKAFSVGAGARLRDRAVAGYGIKLASDGVTQLYDLDKKYYTEATVTFDAWITRRGTFKTGGRTYRHRLQLNVRNLLDDDDPLVQTRNITGAKTRLLYRDGRSFVFSAGLDL